MNSICLSITSSLLWVLRCFSVRLGAVSPSRPVQHPLRRAQRRSRLAGGHRRRRRGAVLRIASTALCLSRPAISLAQDRIRLSTFGLADGSTPAHFRLLNGRKSHNTVKSLKLHGLISHILMYRDSGLWKDRQLPTLATGEVTAITSRLSPLHRPVN